MVPTPPQRRSVFLRNPLLMLALLGGSAAFIGFKWKAVMQRSEEAKTAGAKQLNLSVAPGRSGGGI